MNWRWFFFIVLAVVFFVCAFGLDRAHADDQLAATVQARGLWQSTSSYTPPVYELYATSSPCKATFTTPFPPLTAKLTNIDVPCYFGPSAGTDSEAVILDYKNHRTTETWGTAWTPQQGWTARWGGSEPNSAFAQTDYGIRTWPNPPRYGTQASGIAFFPGIITVRDLASGSIDHAIQIVVPRSCASWVPPATATDGNHAPDGTQDCYKLGTRWKLPQSFNIDPGWPRIVRMMMVAAKRYGFIATDSTNDAVGFRFENWVRPWAWWSKTGEPEDPYSDPDGSNYFGCRDLGGATDWQCTFSNPNLGRYFLNTGFWKALEVVTPPA